MSDQKRTPRAGSPLPGKSPRPSQPLTGNAALKGSGATPPAAKAAPPVRNNPATRSIPVTKQQQPASGRPAPQGASSPGTAGQPSQPGKPGKPVKVGKTGRRIPGAKRPATTKKGTVAKGLLGSKGGSKRAPLSTGPGAKDASGPADEPTLPEEQPGTPPEPEAEQPTAAQPTPSEPTPEQPATEQPAAEEPAPDAGLVLTDLVSHTDAPEWLSDDGARDAEIWSDAFDAEVQQAAPAEPDIIPADEVHLVEPSLDTPSISADVAEAASLPAAAAEVRAVSEEAAEAGRQAGIPEPAPEGTEIAVDAGAGVTELEPETGGDVQAAGEDSENSGETGQESSDAEVTSGPEQAEPASVDKADSPSEVQEETVSGTETGADSERVTEMGSDAEADAEATSDAEADADSTAKTGAQPIIATSVVSGNSNDVAAPVTDSFESLSLTKKVPADDPADTGMTHVVNPSGSTAVPTDSRRARRTREAEEAAASTKAASKTTRTLVLIGSILIVVLLAIWLATVVADNNREAGVLDDSVAPIDLEAGACLQDFQSVNAEVTVVTCDTAHNAQLVASQSYADSDSFPGADALAAKAEEVCNSVMYTDAASSYSDLELNRAVPTQSSWDAGDRRVDCFVVAPGQDLTESLIVQP